MSVLNWQVSNGTFLGYDGPVFVCMVSLNPAGTWQAGKWSATFYTADGGLWFLPVHRTYDAAIRAVEAAYLKGREYGVWRFYARLERFKRPFYVLRQAYWYLTGQSQGWGMPRFLEAAIFSGIYEGDDTFKWLGIRWHVPGLPGDTMWMALRPRLLAVLANACLVLALVFLVMALR